MPPPRGTPNPLEGPGDYTMTSTVHSDTYPEIDPLNWDMVGRTVLIVGASKGAGQATAISFAKAGATKIALAARSSLTETCDKIRAAVDEAGRRIQPTLLTLTMDICSAESVETAMETLKSNFGGILDVLIVTAGVLNIQQVVGSDPELWLRDVHTNFVGPYLVARSGLPLLRGSDIGTFVVMSSVGAHLSIAGVSAYQISKLAVVRLMEHITAETEEEGIVAFSVHPGNMLTEIVGHGATLRENLRPAFVDTPTLAGDGLAFLCKEKKTWLRGRYVNLTWDLPELCSDRKVQQTLAGDLLKVKLAVD